MAVDLLVLRTTRGDTKTSFRLFAGVVCFAHVPRFHSAGEPSLRRLESSVRHHIQENSENEGNPTSAGMGRGT